MKYSRLVRPKDQPPKEELEKYLAWEDTLNKNH